MAITAENLAEKYGTVLPVATVTCNEVTLSVLGITRQDCDDYAYGSQQRWLQAQEAGLFHEEIVGTVHSTIASRSLSNCFIFY